MDGRIVGILIGAALLVAAAWLAGTLAWGSARAAVRRRLVAAEKRQAFRSRVRSTLQRARASQSSLRAWEGWKQLEVVGLHDETPDCRSLLLKPTDGRPPARFEPGQYLSIRVRPAVDEPPLVRCYSLSKKPAGPHYRITVKRIDASACGAEGPGVASTFLHTRVAVGDKLECQAPQGGFFLDPGETGPVVLVGAGIGVTPLVSMAQSLRPERHAGSCFFAGFRNSMHHPFRAEFARLEADGLPMVDTSYSRPAPADKLGRDYRHRGHVSLQRLREVLPSNNFRFYLCGPPAMMHAIVPGLLEWGVPTEDIRYEAFGPASVDAVRTVADIEREYRVEFQSSGKTASWNGAQGSLLELAEQNGVPLRFGCRAGSCGQCAVSVAEGDIQHVKPPGVPLGDRECLACVGVPAGDVVLEA